MVWRSCVFLGLAFALAGCTDADWDRAMTFNGEEHPAVAANDADATPVQTASIAAPSQNGAESPTAVTTQTYQQAVVTQPAPVDLRPSFDMPEAARTTTTTTTTTTTVTTIAPSNRYCQVVAASSSRSASNDGFDAAAQKSAADAIYQQCLAYYGGSDVTAR